jgi:F-type H+-transporting ATPase subunit b
MNIIPDLYLVLVQFVPFFVVIFGLKIILFDPMLAYMHERDASTRGVKHDAEQMLEHAEQKLTTLTAALEKARIEISDYRAKRRADANADYQQVVAEARKAAELRVAEALRVLHQEAEGARKDLGHSVNGLAMDIAQQALGRKLEA